MAAGGGYRFAVEVLLKHNADVNLVDSQGSPPLSYALRFGYLEITEMLLEAGADPNIKNNLGYFPLYYAVWSEKHRLVKLLLDSGADVDAVTTKNYTALHLAIEKTKNMTNASFRTEKLLLQAGADVNAVDSIGRTPLHIALSGPFDIPDMFFTLKLRPKVLRYLESNDAEEKIKEEVRQELARYGGYDEEADSWLRDAILKTILEKQQSKPQNAEEEAIDANDMELIKTVSSMKWEKEVGAKGKTDPIDIIMFLASQPDIQYDIPDRFGRTPLHYAACAGAFSCTTLILDKNVNINAQDLDKVS